MLNAGAAVDDSVLKVLAGSELRGAINTGDEELIRNIRYSISQGHPQVRPDTAKADRVVLVGGGPSLDSTFDELRTMLWEGGSILVTVNGAYHWAIERNLRPQVQIVVDARPHNVRFVYPEVPNCRYVLASQCHPSVWEAVEGRNAWIFHATSGQDDALRKVLDEYYNGQWYGASGGTTVITRAISVLRALGYLRFEMFGVDSCWLGETHHAYNQEENDRDRKTRVRFEPEGHPELARDFICSPWHCKQAEDFIQMIRVNGDQFLLHAHGDGLIAHILKSGADATIREVAEGAGEAAISTSNEGEKE